MRSHLPTLAPRLSHVAALAGLLSCTACAGSLVDPERFVDDGGEPDSGAAEPISGDAACPDVPTQVFAKVCGTSVCHSATAKSQGLDLQSPDVASRLVNVCAHGGGLYVDPDHPTQSVVYTKLTPMPPFGTRMPFAKPPLDDATIGCVLDWVSAQRGDSGSVVCDAGHD
jgi:hypothetical protein